MKPGPEMDALVAEKVMGWTKLGPCEFRTDGTKMGDPPPDFFEKLGRPWQRITVSCYSTDISAAWEVFKEISEFREGYPPVGNLKHPAKDGRSSFYKPVIRLEYYEHDGEIEVLVGRCKGVGHGNDDDVSVAIRGEIERIPYAICLAALKCLGVKVTAENWP